MLVYTSRVRIRVNPRGSWSLSRPGFIEAVFFPASGDEAAARSD